MWADCDSNNWRTVGKHAVTDHDGRRYTAETHNYADISC